MGRAVRKLVIAVLVFGLIGPLRADERAWETAVNAGIAAFSSGDYAAALRHLSDAWTRAKDFGETDGRVGQTAGVLGVVYSQLGQYSEAEPLFRRSLAILEKLLGPEHPDVLVSVNGLGEIYLALGRYGEAEPLLRRALATREKTLGAEDSLLAVSLSNLGELFRLQGRFAEAEPLSRRALAIREKVLGAEHPHVALSLNNLAALDHAQGRFAEAESLYRRSLAIVEKAFGPAHQETAARLNNLAALYGAQRRFAEAEPLYRRALDIWEKALGAEHVHVAVGLNTLGELYHDQRRYADAEPLFRRSLTIREKLHGAEHPELAAPLYNLSRAHRAQGRFAEAEPGFRRALALSEKALGAEHPRVAMILDSLGELYAALRRNAEAEPLHRRALAIWEKALGSEHPKVATTLSHLATVHANQGRYAEAVPLTERALAIRSERLGPEHPDVAMTMNNLGFLYQQLARYAEAEPLQRRALAIAEKAHGPEHPDVALVLGNLAVLYDGRARFGETEPLYRRALAIIEKAHGPEHPQVALHLHNLGDLYMRQGRYAEAEPLLRRALAIAEKAFGSEAPQIAMHLEHIAMLYVLQGRSGEAEPFSHYALAITEKMRGPEHPDMVWRLNNLALLYTLQRRYAETEPIYRRALAIAEKTFGGEHPQVALSFANLGLLHMLEGRYAEAEPLFRRSLAIFEKFGGAEHPDLGQPSHNLALLYERQGRYAEAEPLLRRTLAIWEKVLGAEHPQVAATRGGLALLYHRQGRYAEAEALYRLSIAGHEKSTDSAPPLLLAYTLYNFAELHRAQGKVGDALSHARKASAAMRTRALRESEERGRTTVHELRDIRALLALHVQILLSASLQAVLPEIEATSESLEIAQLARTGDAAKALAQMAARFAAKDDALARFIRQRQDLVERWLAAERALLDALGKGREVAERVARLRGEMGTLGERIGALDARLRKEFPEFSALAGADSVPLAELQALLAPHEAMVSYLAGEGKTYAWVVRQKDATLFELGLGQKALDARVARIRETLDPLRGALRPFAVEEAHALYEQILAPLEPQLKGATHLLIVPDAGLQSLPFGVLIAEKPSALPGEIAEYRRFAWLARKYAITSLPAEVSLRALRRFAKGTPAEQPVVGFGDPLLEGASGPARTLSAAALFPRGAIANVDEVRKLPRLPETADELRQIARVLGAKQEDLYVREAATETNVKRLDLTRYRTLVFATHGLMAGEFKGMAEPALVLTPPKQGTAVDDGLLTASEVADLKLNADWVILSACNTAAPDGTPGAEGLSGLAKAFLYAGSRALLVTHWSVPSDAATELTTRLFREYSANPGIGGAQALRRAMLSVMNDPQRSQFAHPTYWAPFALVGEGR